MLSPPFSPPIFSSFHINNPGRGCVCSSASPLRDPLQRKCLPSWHYWPKAATILAMCSPELGAAAASPFIPCLSLFQGGRKEPPMSPGGEAGSVLTTESANTLLCPTAPRPVRGEHFGGMSRAGLRRSKNNVIPFPFCWKQLS